MKHAEVAIRRVIMQEIEKWNTINAETAGNDQEFGLWLRAIPVPAPAPAAAAGRGHAAGSAP
jgi:hypothetical protein